MLEPSSSNVVPAAQTAPVRTAVPKKVTRAVARPEVERPVDGGVEYRLERKVAHKFLGSHFRAAFNATQLQELRETAERTVQRDLTAQRMRARDDQGIPWGAFDEDLDLILERALRVKETYAT
ncbi:MAG: hypothetical protein ACYDDF_11090 [Thermoplasmatota archaeon]